MIRRIPGNSSFGPAKARAHPASHQAFASWQPTGVPLSHSFAPSRRSTNVIVASLSGFTQARCPNSWGRTISRRHAGYSKRREVDLERTDLTPPGGAGAEPDGEYPIIQLDALRMWFQVGGSVFRKSLAVKAVDDVSLTIYRGETMSLVGESGSGKTTLGRTVLRLLEPTDGRLLYAGMDITRAEREERIFQALENVKLTPAEFFAQKFPHQLSGGQRQRVAVARATILEPEFIVADEPVSMLDASVRISILRLLGQLQKKLGLSFLYVTHDLATARHFADRVGIMYAGRLAESGPIGSVLAEPLHPYTQALMEAIPDPDPENRLRERPTLPGEPPSLMSPPPGCRFHPRCPIAKEGLCEVVEPQLRELRPDHSVACHLAS